MIKYLDLREKSYLDRRSDREKNLFDIDSWKKNPPPVNSPIKPVSPLTFCTFGASPFILANAPILPIVPAI